MEAHRPESMPFWGICSYKKNLLCHVILYSSDFLLL